MGLKRELLTEDKAVVDKMMQAHGLLLPAIAGIFLSLGKELGIRNSFIPDCKVV